MDGETELSGQVIRAALEVHRVLGPGLLESAYRACLLHELGALGIRVDTEVPLAVRYRETSLDCGYRLDLVVEDELIVELKAVQRLDGLHLAQMLTYLKLAHKRLGLLINFNVVALRQGIRRVILSHGV